MPELPVRVAPRALERAKAESCGCRPLQPEGGGRLDERPPAVARMDATVRSAGRGALLPHLHRAWPAE